MAKKLPDQSKLKDVLVFTKLDAETPLLLDKHCQRLDRSRSYILPQALVCTVRQMEAENLPSEVMARNG